MRIKYGNYCTCWTQCGREMAWPSKLCSAYLTRCRGNFLYSQTLPMCYARHRQTWILISFSLARSGIYLISEYFVWQNRHVPNVRLRNVFEHNMAVVIILLIYLNFHRNCFTTEEILSSKWKSFSSSTYRRKVLAVGLPISKLRDFSMSVSIFTTFGA